MLAHNREMKIFLESHGLKLMPKRFDTGSMRGTWRLYNLNLKYTPEIQEKLTGLGFTDWDGSSLDRHSSNGDIVSLCVQFKGETS